MARPPRYALGLDYGTNSVRALIVAVADGNEIATATANYPSGAQGVLLDRRDPNLARQAPGDYINGLQAVVRDTLAAAAPHAGFAPEQIVGIGVDTTGSTPLPVDAAGQPLGLEPRFADNLAAQAWLWKDHTAHAEAAEITALAQHRDEPYLGKCGGTYSSEWFWAKLLHCVRTAPDVAQAAAGWVELADFIPAFLTGNTSPNTIARCICAAGHKAMYHADWGGLPSDAFLTALHPDLPRFRYRTKPLPADRAVGTLRPDLASELGLPAGIPVAAGAFDAHLGAVGAGIRPGRLVKIIGTSTCDCVVAPLEHALPDIPGVCGIVPGSIVPDLHGIEAGQSAVGDIFNWFAAHLTPAEYRHDDAHAALSQAAAQLRPGASGLLALDWNNGNRTVLVNPLLTGLLVGQTLHTSAPEIYRALIEATAFGALKIIERLREYGVAVDEVVNCGGVAEKNPLVMQIYADVCNTPMLLSRSAQTCALGAALFGAVAGGAYPDVAAAQEQMTATKPQVFEPRPDAVAVYARLYALYSRLHDSFGGVATCDLRDVMPELIAIRQAALQSQDLAATAP
jgi:L-ribulokinase